MTSPPVSTTEFYIPVVRSFLERKRLSPAGNQVGPESEDFLFLPGCNREEIHVKNASLQA